MVRHDQTTTEYGTNGGAAVHVTEDGVLIEQYFTPDPQVRHRLSEAPEEQRLGELGRILSVGATVLNSASPLLEVAQVREAFTSLEEQQRLAIEDGAEAIKAKVTEALDPVFGEDGTLKSTLGETERLLKTYLDEESTKSVMSVLQGRLAEVLQEHKRDVEATLTRGLDLNDPESALSKALKRIEEREKEARETLTELATKISGMVERREERRFSTRKGPDYEEAVLAEVARIATLHGDAVEHTAKTLGEAGERRGDIVTTIDSALTAGELIRMVIEAGDRQQLSEKQALKELAEAKENRCAVTAIAVVPSVDLGAARGQRLRRLPDGRFVCVLDNESWDTLPLEVTYFAARVEALRTVKSPSTAEAVGEQLASLVEKALAQLEQLDKVRGHLGKGREHMENAQALVDDARTEVRATLREMTSLLAGAD